MQSSMNNHFDQDEVDLEVDRITRGKCQAIFKTQTRDQVEVAFRNRTNTPAVGHYSPRWTILDKESRVLKYMPDSVLEGCTRKRDLNL